MRESYYAFATCQVGAETALKNDVGRIEPEWRPAYARPGLVTFKLPQRKTSGIYVPSPFARTSGLSLGTAKSIEEVREFVQELHVNQVFIYERPGVRSERDGIALDLPDHLQAPFTALQPLGIQIFVERATPDPRLGAVVIAPRPAIKPGRVILDLIVAPGEPWLIGSHRQSVHHSPFPGARVPIHIPDAAPSRAFAKLEDALLFSGFDMRPGDHAVELGSAPGGAALAMVMKGVHVLGVDPEPMDARVLETIGPKKATVKHLQKSVTALKTSDLPGRLHWFVMGMSIAPQVALHSIRRLIAARRHCLKGVIFTLKLNSWDMADTLPELLGRVQAMGIEEIRCRQLVTNRQEVCVVGRVRRRGSHNPA